MTEISTEPVAEPATATLENTPVSAPATPVSPEETQVEHTEGGWPVVPLAVSGANTTAALIASASLVGGPVAAAVAFTGAVVLGAVATRRTAPDTEAKASDKARASQSGGKSRTAAGQGGRTGGRRLPGQASRSAGHRAGASGRGGRKSGGAGLRSRTASHGTRARTGTGSGGISLAKRGTGAARKTKNPHASKTAGASKAGRDGGSSGRVGQVKALRGAKKQQAPTRSKQRAQASAARRSVADARRQAKQAVRVAKSRAGQRGPLARAKSWGGRKAAAGVKALVNRARAARDRSAERKVAAGRSNVRKAPARRKARRALWRSAARFQGRRLLAALLGGALGLVGCLSTPLGRKLRWSWLMYPGRRLYRRLVARAREEREERDEDTRDVLAEEEAAADAVAARDGEQLDGQVDRPAELVPTSSGPASSVSDVSGGENVSGFRFEEAAAEMEQAALSYDPDNAMEILAMVEGLPAALTSVANVMKTLSERSDSEFPLEKEVAAGFSDIFGSLMSAVAVAEDMGPLFRQVHAQDIARHEDPRNGPEAEKGWNV
ncbi:hypothetical protein [Streptomyces sp. AcE210]|uniref:hypothetical protein n=1 Tax=Streptomyces sp. AcE210 TaxID=2292703 RepID=UPI001F0CA480|nr:hypothetical protein [Streptomyces sp. AcE210]